MRRRLCISATTWNFQVEAKWTSDDDDIHEPWVSSYSCSSWNSILHRLKLRLNILKLCYIKSCTKCSLFRISLILSTLASIYCDLQATLHLLDLLRCIYRWICVKIMYLHVFFLNYGLFFVFNTLNREERTDASITFEHVVSLLSPISITL
jgi:hypothetical protein